MIPKKKFIVLKPVDPNKRVLPIVRQTLLKNSSSDDFNEARREWVVGDIIKTEDDRFVDQCMLCGQGNLGTNFEIINEITGKRLLVGSTCICSFIILKGTESQEDSNQYFARQINKVIGYEILKGLLPSIMEFRPEYKAVYDFVDACKYVLGTLNQEDISPDTWDEFISRLLDGKHDKLVIEKIKQILWDRKKLKLNRDTTKLKDTSEIDGSWAGTIRVRKTNVQTTLRKSKLDNPGS